MDLYEAWEKKSERPVAVVVCDLCQGRANVLGAAHESPMGLLYAPEGTSALQRVERGAGEMIGQLKDLPGNRGQHVESPTLLDVALIRGESVTLAEPRSSATANVPDLIAYCTRGHGDRPLTVALLEAEIARRRAKPRVAV